MKKILTGLKPTGELTLGNYIGAIMQMKKMQEEYDSYIFIADLHALTIHQEPTEIRKRIKDFLALYIACGIDPNKNVIYLQSENEYIPCISWLLECSSYYGEASRMIQFKEKSKDNANFTVGLLTYPILMAADILYCDTDLVPVGIDQKQHVELARDIAIRFNNKYGQTFTVPEVLVKEGSTKIKDLKDPTKKMSKSSESPKGVITLLDTDEEIRKKIMSATTDSEMLIKYDPINKPGISNLMDICTSLSKETNETLEEKFTNKNYGEFKKYVADVVAEHLSNIRQKYYELINSDTLNKILDDGLDKSKKLAKEKYNLMREKMGIVR